jgi:hypothetical protein
MKTVWKFPIKIEDHQQVTMPVGAEIIHVGLDPMREPCMWACVNDEAPLVDRTIYVSGTGGPILGNPVHRGSFVQNRFVWHVWESTYP